jgi:hypothetical protein
LINTRFVERHNYTNINAMLRDAGKWSWL